MVRPVLAAVIMAAVGGAAMAAEPRIVTPGQAGRAEDWQQPSVRVIPQGSRVIIRQQRGVTIIAPVRAPRIAPQPLPLRPLAPPPVTAVAPPAPPPDSQPGFIGGWRGSVRLLNATLPAGDGALLAVLRHLPDRPPY